MQTQGECDLACERVSHHVCAVEATKFRGLEGEVLVCAPCWEEAYRTDKKEAPRARV